MASNWAVALISCYGAFWGMVLAPITFAYVPREFDLALSAVFAVTAVVVVAVDLSSKKKKDDGPLFTEFFTAMFAFLSVASFALRSYINRIHDTPTTGAAGKSKVEDDGAKDPLLGKKEPEVVVPKKQFFQAVNFARYLASLHIVLGHYYTYRFKEHDLFGKPVELSYFDFGGSFVSFFFLLSGFVLTYTHMAKGDDILPHPFKYLLIRFGAFYPLHFVGLVIIVLVRWEVPTLSVLQPLFLVDNLTVLGDKYVGNPMSWFLTVLVISCLVFPFAYYHIRRMSVPKVWALLAVAYLWCWMPQILVSNVMPLSVKKELGTDLSEWFVKDWTCFYQNVICGMCLAKLFAEHNGAELPVYLKYGASIGYACIFAIFVSMVSAGFKPKAIGFGPDDPGMWGANAVRHGCMIPFWLMVLIGLTSREDPVTKLFSMKFFVTAGELSYATYILQEPADRIALTFLKQGKDDPWYRQHLIIYPFVLVPLTILGHHFVSKPCLKLWRKLV